MNDVSVTAPRRPTIRQIRLFTGIVLFVYVTTHFLNHALGLISLDALDAGRRVFIAVWRNPVGTILLYGSLIVHFALALQAIYARRRLNLRAYEWVQLLLGLSVPFILALHVFGTRMAHEVYGVDDNYVYALLVQWHFSPQIGIQQIVLFAIAWIHGCMGLHFYFRLKRHYAPLLPYLFAGTLLVPTLGLLGVGVAADQVTTLAQDQEWLDRTLDNLNPPGAEGVQFVYDSAAIVWGVVIVFLALVMILRALRRWQERRKGLIRITYPGNRKVEIASGPTLLEISRQHDIPHASVCGGRGRCSTCRVRIGNGLDQLEPPASTEVAVLERVGAPPNVRLACQTRPTTDIEITPLLPPTAGPRAARSRSAYLQGGEREILILFAVFAPSPVSPSTSSHMTWFSSSTATLPPWERRSKMPAVMSINSSATA
ncbi:MAG: (2Fe-2S)-binding protein [Alphaproteobacteria bacterium]|nr:(2Fe-2S)-binding protein [Alphaproteobacteria bacterium]